MKGIIFNILEEVITDAYGPEAWDALICMAGVEGAYASLGSYPDVEFFGLIDATAMLTKQPHAQVLRAFGEAAFPLLIERYPHFLEGVFDTRTFLLSLNTIIQPEIRKIYSDAAYPQFKFAIGDDILQVGYRSQRKLCDVAEGFVRGVAKHYGEEIEVEHGACLNNGDPQCRLDVRWAA
mgnify:CR=1 FL=1